MCKNQTSKIAAISLTGSTERAVAEVRRREDGREKGFEWVLRVLNVEIWDKNKEGQFWKCAGLYEAKIKICHISRVVFSKRAV